MAVMFETVLEKERQEEREIENCVKDEGIKKEGTPVDLRDFSHRLFIVRFLSVVLVTIFLLCNIVAHVVIEFCVRQLPAVQPWWAYSLGTINKMIVVT
jgi:hypothetical protein